jgi:hypothetical protein
MIFEFLSLKILFIFLKKNFFFSLFEYSFYLEFIYFIFNIYIKLIKLKKYN